MDSNPQISTTLNCPICKKSGTAIWSSSGEVHGNDLERTLVAVSHGFERGQETDQTGGAEIQCTTCCVSVPN